MREHLGETLGFRFQSKPWGLPLVYSKNPRFQAYAENWGLANDFIPKSRKIHELMSWEMKLDETKMALSKTAVRLYKITPT